MLNKSNLNDKFSYATYVNPNYKFLSLQYECLRLPV